MKAEERHEMETNELVKAIQRARNANRRKIAIYGGLAALVFVVVFFLRYTNKVAAENEASRWVELDMASSKESLKELMEKYRGKPVGTIAKMRYARLVMASDGIEKIGSTDSTQRLAAADGVDQARKLFLELTGEFKENKMLLQEAWEDAAKAEEMLIAVPKSKDDSASRGDIEQAIKYLENAAKVQPDTETGKKTAEKAEKMKADKAKIVAFYQDVQRQLYTPKVDPKPVEKDGLSGFVPDSKPEARKEDGKGPDLKIPDMTKKDETKKEDAKSPELKAPEAKKEEAKAPEAKKEEPKAPELKVPEKK